MTKYLRPPGERCEFAEARRMADAGRMAREAKRGNVCPNCGTSEQTCERRLVSGQPGCCQSCEHPETKEAK